MSPTLLLVLAAPKGFSSRPTTLPPTAVFSTMPYEVAKVNRELLADGKPCGIVFPPNFRPYTSGFDGKDRAIGGLEGTFSGGSSGEEGVLLLPEKKGYRVVSPPGFPFGRIIGRRRDGSYVGLAFTSVMPSLDFPYQDFSHGFLLSSKGDFLDLGPADTVEFRSDGSVEGTYLADKDGKRMSVASDDRAIVWRFRWKDGKRVPLSGGRGD